MSPGSNIIRVDVKSHSRHSCICGTPRCAHITACFQSIGDARGGKFILPSLGGTRNAAIKHFKLQQICHHLGLGTDNLEEYASKDNRNRSLKSPPPPETTMTREKRKNKFERQKKAIAVHHFHPAVVQHYVVDEKINFGDYLLESFVKENGLWENGYTDMDYFPNQFKPDGKKNGSGERVFVPVPTYQNALQDYQLALTRFKIKDIIKSCKDAMSANSIILGRKDDDASLHPVNKKARISTTTSGDDSNELKRAICLLAGEVEQLQQSNKRLEQKLQKSRDNNAAEKGDAQCGAEGG